MTTTVADFATTFELLTGKTPFPWQTALYERFVVGDVPSICNLPTGLGKTSVVAIGLIALANSPASMPRRIVYVVNRRTVVDQTTAEVEKLRANLAKSGLFARLQRLCSNPADPAPLAISTLRGQFADNSEWRGDPARPAVIVGTVDMIGSRLLFSGYGCGFKTRPSHAGLLGQDTLLVHDEAHLEPAFQELLAKVVTEQSRCRDIRPLRLMQLSATARDQGVAVPTFSLTMDDFRNRTVARRMNAGKTVVLHPIDDEKQTSERVADLALEHATSNQAILVYLRRVDDVTKVVDQIAKKSGARVEQLTGTLRGWERDKLAKSNTVFARFLSQADRNPLVEPQPGTFYLVCTSAGEVGVNISADHLVCDLSTFESMAQRFGRVNRFGDRDDARIDVVYPTNLPTDHGDDVDAASESAERDPFYRMDVARQKTLELLTTLNGDGSPAALDKLPAENRRAAFSPQPPIIEATDVLFDAWSLTTIRGRLPGRPPVADWLHGKVEWEPPETQVAWRHEVAYLTHLCSPEQLVEALEGFPLKPHELLRDRTQRVFGHLETLAKRHGDKDIDVWRIDADGVIEPLTLKRLVEKDRQKKPVVDLAQCTIVLPPHAGGLKGGMLDGDAEFVPDCVDYDIADRLYESMGATERPVRMRVRIWDDAPLPDDGKWRLVDTFDVRPEADESDEDESDAATEENAGLIKPPGRLWRWYVRPQAADDDGSKSAAEPQELDSHLSATKRHAERMATALGLEPPLARAVILAAAWHDLGKNRALWQASIGNREYPRRVLAKSGVRTRPFELNRFRHEFGSVLDVTRDWDATLERESDETRELVLHLIAAHHGRGRPHFPTDEAFDPGHSELAARRLAAESPRRFARLQRRYGRWGLAWLESLVRAADVLASLPHDEVQP